MPEPEHFDAVISVPFGRLGLRMHGGAVLAVGLLGTQVRTKPPRDPATRTVVRALRQYFHDPAAALDVPVRLEGTPFQRRVWRALRAIPPGRPVTYGDLAAKLNTSARAIGGACRANPIPIVIPCHRVVGSGHAGGFMGATGGPALDIKRWLLDHEARS